MLSWNMDDASRTLILTLLEQDALEESEKQKGKQKEGILTDHELAVENWSGQIKQSTTLIQDHKMALSIAKAILDDRVALTIAAQEENRASADRRMAFELAGEQPPESDQETVREQTSKLVDTAFAEAIFAQCDEQNESLLDNYPRKRHCVAESSKTAGPLLDIVEMKFECVACNEKNSASKMVQTQCSHWYCESCMVHLVTDALADQTLFPPRCCRLAIPPSSLRNHLNADLFRKFQEKEIENNDPHRTYCSSAKCATYINPLQVKGYVGICEICQTSTCTLCKRIAHNGKCVDEDAEVMQLAQESGWQQCPQCHHVIELERGCNHITCRCRYGFCYVCRMKWKTCRCENWDEARLYDRAQQLAARNAQGPPAEQQVEQVVDRIRNAQCDHLGEWYRVDADAQIDYSDDSDSDGGGFNCDVCDDFLPYFILECPGCQLQACARCKRNRL